MQATTIRTADGYTFHRIKQGDTYVWVDSLDPDCVDMTCEDKDGRIVLDDGDDEPWDIQTLEMTMDADTIRKLYAVLDWASLWMSEYIEDVRTIPQDATAQANIRYYTPLHNTAESIIDMMPWTDSGEGPFNSATDARDYVDSEFHATTRIHETPDGWIIQTLTTQETT